MSSYEERAKAFREMLNEKMQQLNPDDGTMSTFKIIIEEHISQEFEVEASSMEEAEEIAKQKYYDGEFVVDNCNAPTAQLMYVEDEETGEHTEWEEF